MQPPVHPIQANPAVVKTLTEAMLGSLNRNIRKTGRHAGNLEILMAAENVYRIVILSQCNSLRLNADDRQLYANMAVETLDRSLRSAFAQLAVPSTDVDAPG